MILKLTERVFRKAVSKEECEEKRKVGVLSTET